MAKHKIDKKIVDQKVVSDEPENKVIEETHSGMNENVKRPERLHGTTYKIKSPTSGHAMFITINDIILYEGTEHESRYPFEIFINTKNLEHFQWVVALTRILSAIFRKGGDVTFLLDELGSIFDPEGGYFKKGGKYVPSTVAEIGLTLERHLIDIGVIKPETNEKKELANKKMSEMSLTNFPDYASMCKVCNTKAVVKLDGCSTCLNCGEGKCG